MSKSTISILRLLSLSWLLKVLGQILSLKSRTHFEGPHLLVRQPGSRRWCFLKTNGGKHSCVSSMNFKLCNRLRGRFLMEQYIRMWYFNVRYWVFKRIYCFLMLLSCAIGYWTTIQRARQYLDIWLHGRFFLPLFQEEYCFRFSVCFTDQHGPSELVSKSLLQG